MLIGQRPRGVGGLLNQPQPSTPRRCGVAKQSSGQGGNPYAPSATVSLSVSVWWGLRLRSHNAATQSKWRNAQYWNAELGSQLHMLPYPPACLRGV